MTTKYQKTKKMMKQTGLSKKECHDYLMRSGWDLEKAIGMYELKDFDVDLFCESLKKVIDAATEAIRAFAEKLPELIEKVKEQIAANTDALQEGESTNDESK